MAKKFTINDKDRAEFVENEEGMYRWYRSCRQPLRTFVRENRTDIDRVIIEANKPPVSEYRAGYMQMRGAS